MHRLRFRKSWIGLLALVGGAIIMSAIRLNPFSAGTTFDLPWLWIIPAQILLPLFVAFYQYRACPTIQQISAYLWLISMICFMGALGNLFGDPMAIIQQDWLVHFNAVQLGVMNLASLMATINLLHAEEMSSFADAKVAEAQLGRLKAVKVDPETQIKWEKAASHAQAQADGRSLRSTMTNLKAISLHDPSQTLTAPSSMPLEMPKRSSETTQDSGSLASLLDRIGDEPAAVAGEDVLEVNEFQPTAAAEPASAVLPEVAEPQFAPLESSSDFSLLANIDALEAPTTESTIEPASEPVKEPASGGMMGAFKSTSQSTSPTPSEPVATATSQASPQAAAQAASQPSPAAPVAPPDSQNANASSTRLQAMKRRNTSTFTKLQSLSSSTSLKQQPLDTTPQNEPDSLKSLLDRLDDDHVQEPAQPLTPPVELVLDTVFKEDGHLEIAAPTQERAPEKAPVAVVEAPVAVVEAPVVEEAKIATPEPEAHEEQVIESPVSGHSSISDRLTAAAEVASDNAEIPSLSNLLDNAESISESGAQVIDNLISDFSPKESDLEFPKTVEVDLNPLLGEPLQSAQDDTQAVEEAKTTEDDEEVSGSLFDGGLDSDIDNIFSELAPPEAQQEVAHVATPAHQAAPVEEAAPQLEVEVEAEESEGALFDGGLDSDIDDIFSNLAPADALKEVKDVLKPAAKAETQAAEDSDEDGEAEESLFGETLGEDLDNIFSGLTDDQQLDVSPETLAKLKQALPEGEQAEAPVQPAVQGSPRATGDMPALSAEKAEEIKAEAELEAELEAKPESKSEAKAKPASPDKNSPDYKEVKEFGRLSTRSGSLKSAPEAVGTMKTIGKLLLDVKAVENIIKSGENKKIGSGLSTAKVISAARGEGIRNILVAIDTYEGVAGSLIVGHDGLVIASTVGTGWDKDMLGALSTALLSTSNLATKKLEIGKLKQMVLLTNLTNDAGEVMKTTVLTDVEVGILAVFLEQTDLTKIDGLLAIIHSTIHGT